MSRSNDKKFLIHQMNHQSQIVESYKSLRQNVQFAGYGMDNQVILFSSANRFEGRSSVVANLAIAYASENRNKRVLIIDGDLRNPAQHDFFHVPQSPGLSNYLIQEAEIHNIITESSVPNLFLIPSGQVPPNPQDLLSSVRMTEIMQQLSKDFDVILVDSPPTLGHVDARTLATLCEGIVLVIQSGKTTKKYAKKAIASLERTHAKILGLVLNNQKQSKSELLVY